MKTFMSLAFFGSLILSPLGMAQSVLDGKWKADLDKDQYSDKVDVRELTHGIYECRTCDPAYKIKADGRDQSVAGNSTYDTLNVRVVDDHTVIMVMRKSGKLAAETTIKVSDDGNTETMHQVVSDGPQPFTIERTFSRVQPGGPGSHAISGGWKTRKTVASDNVDVTTFKVSGDSLTMTNVDGDSYTAKFGGPPAPLTGDPRWNFASVKLVDARTMEETLRKDDKIVMVTRWSVDADGVTMHASFDDTHGHVFKQSGHKVQ
jgi:hypothetical protein